MTHPLPPLPDLREALSALLKYAEINECQHDETHRGGVIWTICDGCGRKWADDRNPFKGYQEPAAITNARAAIAAHVPEADCGNIAAVPAQPFAPDWVTYRQGVADGAAQSVPVPAGWVPMHERALTPTPSAWSSCAIRWTARRSRP